MKRKVYLTRSEEWIDFAIGAIGFPLLNVAIYVLIEYARFLLFSLDYEPGQVGKIVLEVVEYALVISPWVINIGLLALFAWWRSWITIGALSGWVFLIMASILAGVCLFAGCLLLLGISLLLSGS